MKAVLSNRIYMEADFDLRFRLNEELTYKIPPRFDGDFPEIIRNLVVVNDTIVSIPVGRTDLIPENYEIKDKRILIEGKFPPMRLTLRDSQQKVYDLVEDNYLINAKVGWGKTFTGLAIAGKLNQKTLVVVHNQVLRDQWVEETKNMYGFIPDIIGGGKFGTSTSIVIGNIQSLSKDPTRVQNLFGTLIVDECLDYETLISTDMGIKKLGVIVNQKLPVKVKSYNNQTNQEEFKLIKNYYKSKHENGLKITTNKGILKATNNHLCYVLNNDNMCLKKADELVIGDILIHSNTAHKSTNRLNNKYLDLLLGLILGDGNLAKNTGDNTSIRLRITHGEAQKDYLTYKYNMLKNIISGNIVEGSSGYSNNSIYSFSTCTFEDSFNLHKDIYVKGKKVTISKRLAEYLTERSWAFIYQDDGSISNKSITLSLCEMTLDSLEHLIESLKTLFNIENEDVYVYTCSRGYNYIKIKAKSSYKFITKISKYVHPNIRYKLEGIENLEGFMPINTIEDIKLGYSTSIVTDITSVKLTGGHRYNIEVEDNHNYFANNILVSNCHHTPASTFTNLVDNSKARYKIGLSGTLERKDEKHVVLKDYFGTNVISPPAENTEKPNVHIIESDIHFPNNVSSWAQANNILCRNSNYIELIVFLAQHYSSIGHKVLVVGNRVEFLKECASYFPENEVELCIGETDSKIKNNLKEIMKSKNILFASQQLFSEGMSVNDLSCLILAAPLNNNPLLEQLVGRVIRKAENKKTPLVVDIKLMGGTTYNQYNKRLGHYIDQGYDISYYRKNSS